MAQPRIDIETLHAAHREPLLLFLARRTADPQIALDLWAEPFAHAAAGLTRFRGDGEAEAAGWLYGIARKRLALYHRRGHAEQRALDRLKLERPPADPGLLAQIEPAAHLVVLAMSGAAVAAVAAVAVVLAATGERLDPVAEAAPRSRRPARLST